MNFMEALDLAQKGLKTWAEKDHNRKWWRKIDGTPIPNDLCVVIAETIAAAPVSPPAESGESEDEMTRRILAAPPEGVIAELQEQGIDPEAGVKLVDDMAAQAKALASTPAPQPGGAVKVTDAMVETALRAYFPEDAELSDAEFNERVEHIRDDMRAALTSVLSALSPSPSGWDAEAKDWSERDLDLIAAHEKVEAFKAGAQATRAYDIAKIDEWGDSYYAGLLKDEPLPTPPAGEG